MKNLYKVTFDFLHTKDIRYFEIADIEDLCRYETKTRFVKAETQQKACNIIRHNFGKTVSIKRAEEIKQGREKTL